MKAISRRNMMAGLDGRPKPNTETGAILRLRPDCGML